ncbi:alpha/beta fold hydrolase [Aliiroseovarius crassostreae]|uniref:alpha/beta fold hydrolase n=1 Tax=Aliiroseovarius crassostreae TaxID=154981 RepID=UPI003C7ECE08
MTLITRQQSDRHGTLSYREAGSGPVLVLLHGVGMQSAAWEPQIIGLSQTHRVIALDLPGHGGSSPLAKTAQLADFVDWLHAALITLGMSDLSLAGHSMGALIAAGYAVTHPKNLQRVALLNGVHRRSEEARNAVIARADLIRSGSFDAETPLARWFGDSPIDQDARDKVSRWLSQVNKEGYATAYSAFARGDETYADEINNIPCPLLALTGDGDLNSTPAMSQAMADAAPLGRAMIIEGHRHMVNLTAPDAVNDALLTWLETTPEGETS